MAEPTQVLDTEQYYAHLEALNVAPFWRLPDAVVRPFQPRPPCVPYVWRWRELYPELLRAVQVADLATGADRRVLTLVNPALRPRAGATHTLTASLQLLMPGEVAPAHRHTMAALRFIIAGEGGYTVVEGEKVRMGVGDLILTPSWTWHDHGHEGSQDPVVWLDGLDVPFVQALAATFYQDYPGRQPQRQHKRVEDSSYRYGAGTVVAAKDRPATRHSPLNLYRWQQAYDALCRLREVAEADAHDGYLVEYVHPLTGGHVLPTIACYLQALPAGTHTRAHRHTASTVHFVVRGAGYTVVEGHKYAWEARDIMAIPPWMWHEHVADAAEDAILFVMSDLPVLEPFGLYREEA
ncbi:MAG TPA: cupin domain-containing protein [Chloroflexota bacterium]|nr:cupin domain-containing protein [Chloroflexota bacterium]